MPYRKILKVMQESIVDNVTPEIVMDLSCLKEDDKLYIMRKSAEIGQISILKALLNIAPQLNINDIDFAEGNTALIFAVQNNHKEIVEFLLLQGINPYIQNKKGYTALDYAISGMNIDIVKQFLNFGIRPSENVIQNVVSKKSLFDDQEKLLALLELLLTSGFNPDKTEITMIPPFSEIILTRGEFAIKAIELFLKFNANCNLSDKRKMTPFLYACGCKKSYIIKLLIDHGADIHVTNQSGDTALMLASSGIDAEDWHPLYKPTVAQLRRDLETVKLLVSLGVDINKQNKQGETALIKAIGDRQTEIAKFLIESGANVNLANKKKETAIYLAALNRDMPMCDLLLSQGALKSEMREAESTLVPLPKFTYFSEKALKDAIEYLSDPCKCCSKRVGSLLRISKENSEEVLVCPWCIEKGKGAKEFINTCSIADEKTLIDSKVVKEIRKHTPQLITWQDPIWLTHCGFPCQFLEEVNLLEGDSLPLNIEVGMCIAEYHPISTEERKLLEKGFTGYLFQCLKCSKHLMYMDSV